MGGSIGTISFPYNLYFVDKYEPAPIRFDDMGFDGTIMQIIVQSTTAQLTRTIRFEWITQDQLETLQGYAETGERYTVNLGGGESHVIRFISRNAITYRPVPPEDGFTHEDVDGTALDLYNGEMKVYVDS